MMQLRNYQIESVNNFYEKSGNTLIVLPTGAGKTVVVSEIVNRWATGHVCVMAHRQELVTQISCALARDGIEHTIIAPKSVIKNVTKEHLKQFNKVYYKTTAKVIVASVQTLVRRDIEYFASLVTLWVIDEAHHVLTNNIWGKATKLFPNARGLGVTATPIRADGKALGSEYDGEFDHMIVGEKMTNLISQGYLCRYRIFSPKSKSLDLSTVDISKRTGDFSKKKLAAAAGKSNIHGDIVEQYLKIAPGKRGVTFVPSVETAVKVSAAFNAAGVPAEVVSAKTPDALRIELVNRLRSGNLLQLVNVDLFGEGFDLPAIEVVSMARPTKSYSLFSQQFGRALRPLEGKSHAIIIDHVGNVVEHGLPEFNEKWTLGYYTEKKGTSSSGLPLYKVCPACTEVYERFYKVCPVCQFVDVPAEPALEIEVVDGDLTELCPMEIEKLRAEKQRVEAEPYFPQGAQPVVRASILKRHSARLDHLALIKFHIAEWIGRESLHGYDKATLYRKFYLTFGVDVLTAQTRRDNVLLEKLAETLGNS